MASNVSEEIFQCSNCELFLDLASKTLPCLHSLCRSCVEDHIEGATVDSSKCPQCHEPVVTRDQLTLAPFLVKSLKRRHLESSEWWCEFCSKDGIETAVQIWCKDCEKLLCQTCERFHKRFHPEHETKDLRDLAKVEAINVMTMNECCRHRKSKDTLCGRCNVCLCDVCFKDHVRVSPQCPLVPLSVREETSKEKMRGPTLEQELREFEIRIRAANERTRQSIDQLSTDCDSKCSKLWQDFEAFMEAARLKLGELCDNMRETTSEQVRKWRLSLKERDELLEKVKIWRNTVHHLLRDNTEDADVVCGLRLVGGMLSSRLRQSFAPTDQVHLIVTFPKWCHDSLVSLQKEMIYLTAETSMNLQLDRECHLQESDLVISSIVASDKDNHVFVCDFADNSILEFGETGELIGQYRLTDGGKEFCPWEICHLFEDILVVCGLEFLRQGRGGKNIWGAARLFFLARRKFPPFLEIQKIIGTKDKKFYSLCQIDKNIFACDFNFKKIVCFSENGEEIKTIHIGGLPGSGDYPRLRADPTTGNLWGTRGGMSEIFVFNQNGQILQKLEIQEEIFDFSANKFGLFYFSSKEKIFSVLPEKVWYKFPKESENDPTIFVSPQKLFVYFKNDEENLVKIFKIN